MCISNRDVDGALLGDKHHGRWAYPTLIGSINKSGRTGCRDACHDGCMLFSPRSSAFKPRQVSCEFRYAIVCRCYCYPCLTFRYQKQLGRAASTNTYTFCFYVLVYGRLSLYEKSRTLCADVELIWRTSMTRTTWISRLGWLMTRNSQSNKHPFSIT
jgi:hypothetical protein